MSATTFDPWVAARRIVEIGIQKGLIIPPVIQQFAQRRAPADTVHTTRSEREIVDALFGASPDQVVSRSEARGVCLRPVVWEYFEVAAAENGMSLPQFITVLARYHATHTETINAALVWPPVQ